MYEVDMRYPHSLHIYAPLSVYVLNIHTNAVHFVMPDAVLTCFTHHTIICIGLHCIVWQLVFIGFLMRTNSVVCSYDRIVSWHWALG